MRRAHESPGLGEVTAELHARDAKIHKDRFAVLVQHYIRGFDVAMDDIVLMRVRQSIRNLLHDGNRFTGRDHLLAMHFATQRLAFDELHDEVVDAV